jgi:alpha-ribazole phosphatase
MTRQLLLVRHGRIESGHQGQFIGSTDPVLDAHGESQVQSLAARVQEFHPDICYCSPLQRCRQTASALAADVAIRCEQRLREIDFGQWERRTFEDVAQHHPEQVAQWAEFAPSFTFPGGDNLAEFVQRVRAAAELLCHTDARTVLAVTHGGVIRLMLCHLLGLDLRKYVVFDVGYASLAVIDLFEDGGVLTALERAA